MTTAVVTDSTTSLAPGVLERPDVRMVPLTFHFGQDETYTDKVDMSNEEFYERLRDSDVLPDHGAARPRGLRRGLRGALRLRRHPGAHALEQVQRHLRLGPAGGGDGGPARPRARHQERRDGVGFDPARGPALYRRGRGLRRGQARGGDGPSGGRTCSSPWARWSTWPRAGA